jgi:exopolysaccharide biosynthesis protein
MAERDNKTKTIAIWVPVSILLLGIATTTYMISRNGKSGYAKLK